MNYKRIVCSLTSFLAICQVCFGQVTQFEPKLINELKEGYCSEILARDLDYFAIEMQNNPSAKGLVIFYGKVGQEGKNLLYLGSIKPYLQNRGISEDVVSIIRGENKNEMIMQFWIVPAGANSPKPESEFIEEQVTKPTRFDFSWADLHKPLGKWTIHSYSFADWGCNMDLNMKRFVEILKSNPKLTGYVVVFTQ